MYCADIVLLLLEQYMLTALLVHNINFLHQCQKIYTTLSVTL